MNIRELINKPLYWYQRAKRGYSDEDVWDLSHYLSGVIAGSVEQYRLTSHGCPTDIIPNFDYIQCSWKEAHDEWDRVLKQISDTFKEYHVTNGGGYASEKILDEWNKIDKLDTNKILAVEEQFSKTFEEAMQLFAKWFGGLWD